MRYAVRTFFHLFNLAWLVPLAMACLLFSTDGVAAILLHTVGVTTTKIMPDPFWMAVASLVGWKAAEAVINIMDA